MGAARESIVSKRKRSCHSGRSRGSEVTELVYVPGGQIVDTHSQGPQVVPAHREVVLPLQHSGAGVTEGTDTIKQRLSRKALNGAVEVYDGDFQGVGVDTNVLGFDVSMKEPSVVDECETVQHLCRNDPKMRLGNPGIFLRWKVPPRKV